MPSGGIVWYADSLSPQLKNLTTKLDRALDSVMDYEANQVQNDMRVNAPWTDRTGNARNGLFTKAGSTPTSKFIVLYHTVPYGIWLEVKNDGEYAIILPTIQADGPRVMRSVSKILRAVL